jgi:hypothetical protein
MSWHQCLGTNVLPPHLVTQRFELILTPSFV